MKAPTRFAALANCVSIHSDDYDDSGGSGVHVTVLLRNPGSDEQVAGDAACRGDWNPRLRTPITQGRG